MVRLCKTTQTVYKNAVKKYNEGDEEMGYIYFMKYLNLVQIIKKHPDYSKDKKKMTEYLKKNEVEEALNCTEKLNGNLSRRYCLF